MDKNGLILQLYARGKSPNRDYYGLTITEKQVILNIWNISYGPHVFPKNYKCILEDFTSNKVLMEEVNCLFGNYVLEFCKSLSQRDPKLECMPTKIFLCILRHLAANDVLRLSQTSKIFFELCNRKSARKILFGKKHKNKMIDDLSHMEGQIKKTVIKSNPPNYKTRNKLNIEKPNPVSIKLGINTKQLKKPHTISPIIKETPENQIATRSIIPKSDQLSKKIDLNAISDSNMKRLHRPTNITNINSTINKDLSSKNDFQEKNMCKGTPHATNCYTNPFRCSTELYRNPSMMMMRSMTKSYTVKNKSISSTHLNNAKITNVEDTTTQNNKLNNLISKSTTVNLINNLEKSSMKKDKNVNLIGGGKAVRDKPTSLKNGLKKIVSFKNS